MYQLPFPDIPPCLDISFLSFPFLSFNFLYSLPVSGGAKDVNHENFQSHSMTLCNDIAYLSSSFPPPLEERVLNVRKKKREKEPKETKSKEEWEGILGRFPSPSSMRVEEEDRNEALDEFPNVLHCPTLSCFSLPKNMKVSFVPLFFFFFFWGVSATYHLYIFLDRGRPPGQREGRKGETKDIRERKGSPSIYWVSVVIIQKSHSTCYRK